MHRDKFRDYCQWAFDILLYLEDLIDPSDYPTDKLRVFGYMHELLLSVYIAKMELRVRYSQILWITDDHKFSRFNSLFYRSLCAGIFYFTRSERQASFLNETKLNDG
jgi:hypothetical protein